MSTRVRLTAFVAVLAAVFGGAWAVGAAVGPVIVPVATVAEPATESGAHGHRGTAETETISGTVPAAEMELPGGLASSRGGYTLVPVTPTLAPGAQQSFAFRVTGSDGAPVTAFDVEHDKRMHLIVVRRDGAAFQHVHPEMAADGTWSVPLTLPAGGSYRAFADFTPAGGEGVALGVDLAAPGTFEPVVHSPSRVAEVDGYRVELAGELVPGQASPVTLTVSRNGQPVTDLQPYLAAYGHLVALRGGDLAYLHVHPEGEPGDGRTPAGPAVEFVAEVPSAGTYRLFLDFQHNGIVRTAEFTVPTVGEPVQAPAAGVPAAGLPEAGAEDHSHTPGEEDHDR